MIFLDVTKGCGKAHRSLFLLVELLRSYMGQRREDETEVTVLLNLLYENSAQEKKKY